MNMLQSANSARGMAAAAMKTGLAQSRTIRRCCLSRQSLKGTFENSATTLRSFPSRRNTRYFWLDPRSCQLLYYKSKKTSKSRSPSGGFRLEDILYICFDDKQLIVKGGSKSGSSRKLAPTTIEAYDSINGKRKPKTPTTSFRSKQRSATMFCERKLKVILENGPAFCRRG